MCDDLHFKPVQMRPSMRHVRRLLTVESAVCDHIFDLPEQNRRVAVEWVAGGILGSEKCFNQLHSAAAQKRIRSKNATSNMVNPNTRLLDNGPKY